MPTKRQLEKRVEELETRLEEIYDEIGEALGLEPEGSDPDLEEADED